MFLALLQPNVNDNNAPADGFFLLLVLLVVPRFSGLSIQDIAARLTQHPRLQLRYLDGVWQHPRAKQIYNDAAFTELHQLQVKFP